METLIILTCLFVILSFAHLGHCARQSYLRSHRLSMGLSNKLKHWGAQIQAYATQGSDVVVRMPTHVCSNSDLPLWLWKDLHRCLEHHLHPLCATKTLEITKTAQGRTFQILNLRKVVNVSKYPHPDHVSFDIDIKIKETSNPNRRAFWLRIKDHVYQAGWQIRPL